MNHITVLPLFLTIPNETLSYFSTQTFKEGDVLLVPLQKQTILCCVVACVPLQTQKAAIKTLSYTLKQLPSQVPLTLFLPSTKKAFKAIAEKYYSTQAHVIRSCIPEIFRDMHVSNKQEKVVINRYAESHFCAEEYLFITYLETAAREAIAQNKQLLILCPSYTLCTRYSRVLSKSLQPFIAVFGGKTKKETQKNIVTRLDSGVPCIVFGLHGTLTLPYTSLHGVIVAQATEEAYTRKKPYLSLSLCGQELAKAYNCPFCLYDRVLNASYTNIQSNLPVEYTYKEKASFHEVYMRQEIRDDSEDVGRLIHPEVKKEVSRVLSEGSSVCIYTVRKGLFPSIVCQDCGHTKKQHSCISHRIQKQSRASSQKELPDTCEQCGSWRLKPSSIAIEHVYEKLAPLFPNIPSFLASTASYTDSQLKKFVETWNKTQGPKLIFGTKKILSLLSSVDYTIVISLDTLFSLPEPYLDEQILKLLYTLYEKTSHGMVVQTRFKKHPLLQAFKTNTVKHYLLDLASLRKQEHLPPFGTIVKLTIPQVAGEHILEKLKYLLRDYTISEYTALTNEPQKKATIILITLSRYDPLVHTLLLRLPRFIRQEVNPSRYLW